LPKPLATVSQPAGGTLKKSEQVSFRRLLPLLGSATRLRGVEFGHRFERLLKTNGQIGSVRFYRFGFDTLPQIVTGPDFLDFLVTFRDITPVN
jgi:hypothetical protein